MKKRPSPGGGEGQGDLFGSPAPSAAAPPPVERIRIGELGSPMGAAVNRAEQRVSVPGGDAEVVAAGSEVDARDCADASVPPAQGRSAGPAFGFGSLLNRPVAPVAEPKPPEAPAKNVLTVGELTRRIKSSLESGYPRVSVRGEVSGYRGPHVKGHLYFTLKDDAACIDVKMWASSAQRLKFKLREGMELLLEGSIDVYEKQGRYSLIAHRAEPVGEGALALAFQQLKERLTAEGLMGEGRKRAPRPLPLLPRRIGIVTSRTGAALKDFLRVLYQRHPRMSVLLCDARVQGEGATDDVCRALTRLAATNVDVIVVTRGGGSVEDLWTFNEERVARAIHACPVPVVSAIGHEVDFTIADFVADHRAPTPTAAAALLAPVLADLELQLRTYEVRLRKAAERQLLHSRQTLSRLQARLADPRRVLGQKRLHLNALLDRSARVLRQKLKAHVEKHRALSERLSRMRPEARLGRDKQHLAKLHARLNTAIRAQVQRHHAALGAQKHRFVRALPTRTVAVEKRRLGEQRARLEQLQRRQLHRSVQRFREAVAQLHAMSPLAVMSRGFAVTFNASDGRVVRGAADVSVGDSIRVVLAGTDCTSLQGCDEVTASVTNVRPGRKGPGESGGQGGTV